MGATGKTLVGLWVFELSGVQRIVVFVPTITLVSQVCIPQQQIYRVLAVETADAFVSHGFPRGTASGELRLRSTQQCLGSSPVVFDIAVYLSAFVTIGS